MSVSDIAQPSGCSARARSALAAARDAVGLVLTSKGVPGEGLATIQSIAVDTGGLDLGECKRWLVLSLAIRRLGRSGAGGERGGYASGWRGGRRGGGNDSARLHRCLRPNTSSHQ
eukprot:1602-Pleurochrysis_carterae.AAC.1